MLGRLFTAKMVALLVALFMMASTVSIYAASISGTAKKLGGTGNVTVAVPSSNADLSGWTLSASGTVSSVQVTWTPAAAGNYSIQALLKNGSSTIIGSGTATISGSGTVQRSDIVTITQTDVDPALVVTAVINIRQTT